MATLDERVLLLEQQIAEVKTTVERHSKKLSELGSFQDAVGELKVNMKKLDTTVTDLKRHQTKTDRQLLKYSKWTIVLLSIIIGLFIWIGTKSSSTAKDLAVIVAGAGIRAL